MKRKDFRKRPYLLLIGASLLSVSANFNYMISNPGLAAAGLNRSSKINDKKLILKRNKKLLLTTSPPMACYPAYLLISEKENLGILLTDISF